MKLKYASVIASICGTDREVVDTRVACDGWVEVEGDTIVLHLRGVPVGPIRTFGVNPRLALYAEAEGGEPLATLVLAHETVPGDYVKLG
jgi:hypothetical protein